MACSGSRKKIFHLWQKNFCPKKGLFLSKFKVFWQFMLNYCLKHNFIVRTHTLGIFGSLADHNSVSKMNFLTINRCIFLLFSKNHVQTVFSIFLNLICINIHLEHLDNCPQKDEIKKVDYLKSKGLIWIWKISMKEIHFGKIYFEV